MVAESSPIAADNESTRGANLLTINTGISDGAVSRAFPVEAGKTYRFRFRERWDAGTGVIYAGIFSSPNAPAAGFVDSANRTTPTAGWGQSYVAHNSHGKGAGSGGWIVSQNSCTRRSIRKHS